MNIYSKTIIALLPFLLYSLFNIYLFAKNSNNIYSIIIVVLTVIGFGFGFLYSVLKSSVGSFGIIGILTIIAYLFFVMSIYAKALHEKDEEIYHSKIWINSIYSAGLFAGLLLLYVFLLQELVNQPFSNIMKLDEGMIPNPIDIILQQIVPISGNMIMMLYIASSGSFFGKYSN